MESTQIYTESTQMYVPVDETLFYRFSEFISEQILIKLVYIVNSNEILIHLDFCCAAVFVLNRTI